MLVVAKFHDVPGITRLAAFKESVVPAFNVRFEQVPAATKVTTSLPCTTTLSTERGTISGVHVVAVFQSPPPVPLLVIVNGTAVNIAWIV